MDGPESGQVLFVSDDGSSSTVYVIGIDGSGPEPMQTLPGVAYTARLSPDGLAAYVVVLDRDTGRDLGVWRVRLHGAPLAQAVMPPPSVDRAALRGGNRLAATTRFVRKLQISADGSQVARLACGEPYGVCVLDVLNVIDGTIASNEPPGQSGDLTAIGDGVILGIDYCITATRCVTDGIDVPGTEVRQFPGWPPALDQDGHLLLLQFPGPTRVTRSFVSTLLDGSGTRLVFVTDGYVRPIYQEGIDFVGVRMELPWGWVAVNLEWLMDDGEYRVVPAAVRLADGGWVVLTLPEIYPIGGGHD